MAHHQQRGFHSNTLPGLLLPSELTKGLKTKMLGREIHYYRILPSTNLLAKDMARRGAPEGTLVVTEEQSKGQGRRGRSWFSPGKQGLLFSVILRPPLSPVLAPHLTLLAAVAVAETLREHLGVPAAIKWPNDIYLGGRKLAGILTELNAEAKKIHFAVLGVGINVNTPPGEFPISLRERVTSLQAERNCRVERIPLLQEILLKLEQYYMLYLQQEPEFILEKWREMALYLGETVLIITPKGNFSGRAVDIDQDGALLVEKAAGQVQRVLAGDVSLRSGSVANNKPELSRPEGNSSRHQEISRKQ
jgi:BirA family biotin operon repressor/biotin-[acetyl-CoA-carboxylase] ligase